MTVLIDLPSISDTELKDHQNIGPLEVIFKQIRNKDFELKIRELMADLHAVDDDSKIIILKYVIGFLNLSDQKVMALVQESLPKSEGLIMNAIEQWIQQGVEKGMQQGMQQGMLYSLEETARNMLMKGMDEPLIQEITQLSSEKIYALKRKMRH